MVDKSREEKIVEDITRILIRLEGNVGDPIMPENSNLENSSYYNIILSVFRHRARLLLNEKIFMQDMSIMDVLSYHMRKEDVTTNE